jgi:hypothetical protein
MIFYSGVGASLAILDSLLIYVLTRTITQMLYSINRFAARSCG